MSSPSVSIIVPVYKVENYLEDCINSLVRQTLNDIEIILVDDGSPDCCPSICDAYAKHDNRIRVVHKENGGLSSARNAGLQVARGEWVGFVDSDDEVEPCMFETMYKIAIENNVDFVMVDYLRINSKNKKLKKTKEIPGGLYNRNDIVEIIFPQLIMTNKIDYGPLLSVCVCIYNRKFLLQNSLSFHEQIKWSEDNLFSALAGYCCQSFFYLKGQYLYHYKEHGGTITTSYKKGAWDIYYQMNQVLHNYFDAKEDYDFSPQLKWHLIYYACLCVGQEKKHALRESLENIKSILNNQSLMNAFSDFRLPSVPWKFKIFLWLMKHQCSWVLWRI